MTAIWGWMRVLSSFRFTVWNTCIEIFILEPVFQPNRACAISLYSVLAPSDRMDTGQDREQEEKGVAKSQTWPSNWATTNYKKQVSYMPRERRLHIWGAQIIFTISIKWNKAQTQASSSARPIHLQKSIATYVFLTQKFVNCIICKCKIVNFITLHSFYHI